MADLRLTEFTDPGCPFAWSAEPSRRRLEWLYGERIDWSLRMVGLAETPEVYAEKGFTPERQSSSFRRLSAEHHMPMDTSLRPRVAATVPACRAVVAVRLNDPDRERAMLRQLRVLHFAGHLLDDPQTIDAAAERAGVDRAALSSWLESPETEERLREDLELARRPTEPAVALAHKLAETEDGHRYTCPSYEFQSAQNGRAVSVPGFQPLAAYEVAVANVAPGIERRADPESVEEALEWAGEPLATAEVAALCAIGLEDAREQLGRVAEEEHVGFDGFWRLAA